jgi:hypothetical protein
MDCSGKATAVLIVPDDKSQPIEFRMDTNKDEPTRMERYQPKS